MLFIYNVKLIIFLINDLIFKTISEMDTISPFYWAEIKVQKDKFPKSIGNRWQIWDINSGLPLHMSVHNSSFLISGITNLVKMGY